MKAAEIKVGGVYRAAVSERTVDVRVDRIVERWNSLSRQVRTHYEVTNLKTGRRIVFRSAQRFRGPSGAPTVASRDAADRVYLAARPREAASAGRAWLLGHYEGDHAACRVLRLTNQVGIVLALDKAYEGGWEAFLTATGNTKVAA